MVDLDAYRRRLIVPPVRPARLYVDLANPDCLDVAERVDRGLGRARLRVASASSMVGDGSRRCSVERSAAYAVACGRGNPFVLACLRLAWGGGFDVREPDVLAEAVGSAGLDLAGTLAAARDPRWDAPALVTGYLLRRGGVSRVPALQLPDRWVTGADPVRAFLVSTSRRPRAAR